MSVVVDIKRIGTFNKLRDKTAVVGGLPNLLDDNPKKYGLLKEENQMDLKKGSDRFRDEGYGDLFYSFFDCLIETSRPGVPLKKIIASDFISTRRNLIKFAETVYSRQSFVIRALRKNGVIFLCDKRSENEGPDRNDRGHGYKFEQYMTLDENGESHDEEIPASNSECSRAVLRTSFKLKDEEIKVLYAAEMDAQDTDGNFVELKSTKRDHEKWLRCSSLNHYLQSYLGNVSYIVKGQSTVENIVFRDRFSFLQ